MYRLTICNYNDLTTSLLPRLQENQEQKQYLQYKTVHSTSQYTQPHSTLNLTVQNTTLNLTIQNTTLNLTIQYTTLNLTIQNSLIITFNNFSNNPQK